MKNKISIFIILLCISVLFSGCINQVKTKYFTKEKGPATQLESLSSEETEEVLEEEPLASEQKEVDMSTWETYKNKEFGIEFKHPPKAHPYMYYYNGNYNACGSGELEKDIMVPYKVFAGENDIFIKEEYYYTVDDENKNCQKIENTFESLMEIGGRTIPSLPWHIMAIDVYSEEDVSSYIINNIGDGGCRYEGKYETDEKGVFDVKIKSINNEPGSTECWVNWDYYLRYIPERNKLYYWDTGLECIIGEKFPECFDEEIFGSIKFIEEEEVVYEEGVNYEIEYPSDYLYSSEVFFTDCDYPNFPNECLDGEDPIVLGDDNFCLKKVSEGAAGSIYTIYSYTTVLDNECRVVKLTKKLISDCGVYDFTDEEEYEECEIEKENTIRDMPDKMNEIMASFKSIK